MRAHVLAPLQGALLCSYALLACALVSCTGSSISKPLPPISSPSEDLLNPPEVQSSGGTATLDLHVIADPRTGAPAFTYNGIEQAPTIRISPGDTIAVAYTNDLPLSNADPMNMSNLHFHGLLVSPNPPQDDVLRMTAMPGQTLRYSVRVPPEQPPGLYWYHPHAHGETNWQVSNGMSGAIVVEGVAAYAPQIAGLRERVLVVRDSLISPDFATLANIRRARRLKRRTFSIAASSCVPEENRTLSINGLTQPTLAVATGERQFWRIVNAGAGRYLDLAVDGEQIQLVALDGVPLAMYPGNPQMQSVDHVLVPPAGRAEIIVTGKPGAVLRTRCFDSGPDGDPNPEAVLALLKPATAATLSPETARVRPARLFPPVNGVFSSLPVPNAKRTVVFSEDNDTGRFFLDDKQFNPSDPAAITVQSGFAEEWTILNTTGEVHDFHIHQVHFIVEEIDGLAQTNRRWADTVNVPYQTTAADGTNVPGSVRLLIDFRDPIVRGTFVYHCHLLEHEDGGMMAKISVL